MTVRFLILPHLLLPRAWLSRWRRWRRPDGVPLIVRIGWLRLGVLHFGQTSTPVIARTVRSWSSALESWSWSWSTPLRSWRSPDTRSLICLGVHILRHWGAVLIGHARRLSISKQLQSRLDMHVGRVEVGGALICIKGIVGLVIT